ncbi:MAG: NAD+ synthase [Bacteroidales bacterium]|jgi:NAD+ synthase (glutamine-hydrolysing)|nr:NAD+ synthase [Bacteroidales bacterium]
MKIQIAQLNPKTLNIEANFIKAKEALAKVNQDVLTVFPELALSGSPLFATADYEDIYKQVAAVAERLCSENKDCIVGLPTNDGVNRYNSLAFIAKGELVDLATKKNLGSFDGSFSKGDGFEVTQYEGKMLAFGFEEDFEDFVLRQQEVDVVVCMANNVFEINKQQETINKFIPAVRKMACRFIYVNRCGAEGSYIFNGGSFVLNEKGNLCEQMPLFNEQSKVVETNALSPLTQSPMSKIEKMYNAVVLGIGDYFRKNGIKKAVIGLSGGIDSALVAALAVRAIGNENVVGVLMPSEYSTDHSIKDAEDLANNLQIKYYVVPIKPLYQTALQSLSEVFANTERGLAEENMQARIRCQILMGVANKIGAVLLNTSNKSEAAVGYGTLYGDTSGGIGAIGDMYKTEVWAMARWINRERIIIPENSITKAPSAELSYGQKDSDALPEYDLLDKILYLHIEGKQDKEQIIAAGYDGQTVDKVLHLVKINEWKRHQCCPCLKLSSCTLGIDRLMPVS